MKLKGLEIIRKSFKKIKKYVKVLASFFRASIIRYNNYKIEYIYSLSTIIPFLITLFFWKILEDSIEGWSFNDLALLTLMGAILSTLIELGGFWGVMLWFDRNDRGNLALMITKPINPLIYLHGINFFPGSIPKLIFYLMLLITFIIQNNISISILSVVGVVFSYIVFFLFLGIIECIIIAFDKAAIPLFYTIIDIFKIADKPIDLSSVLGVVLTFFVPLTFAALIPSKILYEGRELALFSFIMTVVMLIMFSLSYRFAMKRFEAVGG